MYYHPPNGEIGTCHIAYDGSTWFTQFVHIMAAGSVLLLTVNVEVQSREQAYSGTRLYTVYLYN